IGGNNDIHSQQQPSQPFVPVIRGIVPRRPAAPIVTAPPIDKPVAPGLLEFAINDEEPFDFNQILPNWTFGTIRFGADAFLNSPTRFILYPKMESSHSSAVMIKIPCHYIAFAKARSLPIAHEDGTSNAADVTAKYDVVVHPVHQQFYSEIMQKRLTQLMDQHYNLVLDCFHRFHREYLEEYWPQSLSGELNLVQQQQQPSQQVQQQQQEKYEVSKRTYDDASTDGESIFSGNESSSAVSDFDDDDIDEFDGGNNIQFEHEEENDPTLPPFASESSKPKPILKRQQQQEQQGPPGCTLCQGRAKCTFKHSCGAYYSCARCFTIPMRLDVKKKNKRMISDDEDEDGDEDNISKVINSDVDNERRKCTRCNAPCYIDEFSEGD